MIPVAIFVEDYAQASLQSWHRRGLHSGTMFLDFGSSYSRGVWSNWLPDYHPGMNRERLREVAAAYLFNKTLDAFCHIID